MLNARTDQSYFLYVCVCLLFVCAVLIVSVCVLHSDAKLSLLILDLITDENVKLNIDTI